MGIAEADGSALSTPDHELQLELDRAEALLKGIIIPPRPEALVAVLNEQHKAEPDVSRLADVISDDVALSASTLKIVNSPFFGLRRKVSSIQHAVRMLGVGNVANIVTGLMLHSAFRASQSAVMDTFWAASSQVAMAAAAVARVCGGITSDEAYAAGLLADCGVPMLMRRFPEEYATVYQVSLQAADRTSTAVETAYLGTDHALVGYLVARSWKLPASLCECILHHHDLVDRYSTESAAEQKPMRLIAILKAAHQAHRAGAGMVPEYEWTVLGPSILNYLGLTEARFEELVAEVAEMQRAHAASA